MITKTKLINKGFITEAEYTASEVARKCYEKELATYKKSIARFLREPYSSGVLIDALPDKNDTYTVSNFILKNATTGALKTTLLLLGTDTEFKGTYNWKEGDTLYGYCRFRGGRYEVTVSTVALLEERIAE